VPDSVRVGNITKSDAVAIGAHARASKIINVFGGAGDASERRKRLVLLGRVRDAWIETVLERSVHGTALLELGKEMRSDAVEQPWGLTLQTSDPADRTLPARTRILDVFEEVGQALLVLGEPGSGKTTTLLQLAKAALKRSEDDPSQPTPVVLNLSAWKANAQPLSTWLIEELVEKYAIPRSKGREWLEQDQLLLLLDGLDEVAADQREAAVERINEFRSERGLTGIGVCCRAVDYAALTTRLRLGGAVCLQPLSDRHVERYLAAAGPRLASLREGLHADAELRELSRSPLMLSVMSLAYQDAPPGELAEPSADASIESRERHLFETYVERMLARRGSPRYDPRDTRRWLGWLARRMGEHGLSTFAVEGLQPSWLADSRSRKMHAAISYGVLWTLLLLGLMAVGDLNDGAPDVSTGALSVAIAVALGAGIGFLMRNRSGPIRVIAGVHWSWRRGRRWWLRTSLGFVVFYMIGLVAAAALGATADTPLADIDTGGDIGVATFVLAGAVIILVSSAFLGLFGLLVGGLSGDTFDQGARPNQGIWQSGRAALLAGTVSGLALGAAGAASVNIPAGVIMGLITATAVGWVFGGSPWLRHFVLRLLAWRNGDMPWRYVEFLDHATACILLQRVGGGYVFIHRKLLEHFAEQYGGSPG
jgi:hypothetical protein